MKQSYEDILHLPHPVSSRHPQMARRDRAAQFSPFAALTGYEDAVREEGRLTVERIELDENRKEEMGRVLQKIRESLPDSPAVALTWFQPDARKSGGAYCTTVDYVRRIDEVEHCIWLCSGLRIPVDDIWEISEKPTAREK